MKKPKLMSDIPQRVIIEEEKKEPSMMMMMGQNT
jgi:hypothetical protein